MTTYHSTPETYRAVGRRSGPLVTSLYDLNILSTSKRVKWKPDPQEKSDCSPGPGHLQLGIVSSSANTLCMYLDLTRKLPYSLHGLQTATSYSLAPSEKENSRKTSKAHLSQPVPPVPRSKRGMTGMLDIDRSHTRRERTFAGAKCIVCDEPVLVKSGRACFYVATDRHTAGTHPSWGENPSALLRSHCSRSLLLRVHPRIRFADLSGM